MFFRIKKNGFDVAKRLWSTIEPVNICVCVCVCMCVCEYDERVE